MEFDHLATLANCWFAGCRRFLRDLRTLASNILVRSPVSFLTCCRKSWSEKEVLSLFPKLEDIVRRFFEEITSLGSIYLVFVYIVTLELLGEKVSSRLLAIATAINSAVVFVIKNTLNMPRPPGGEQFLTASFPSGHAATAFMVAAVLGYRYPALRYWTLLMASVVAVSRVVIGAHFVKDIVAGAAIGYIIGFLVVRYSESYVERWVDGGTEFERLKRFRKFLKSKM